MINRFIKTISILIFVMSYAGQVFAIDKNIYFVGNSLTHRTKLAGLQTFTEERGHTFNQDKAYEDYSQIISGSSLWWHWYHGNASQEFYYKDEFIPDMTTGHWDALVLQPYDGKPWHWNTTALQDGWYYWQDRPREEGDIPMALNFIDLMINQGDSDSGLQVYIYSQWPAVPGNPDEPDFENFDYQERWNRDYTDTTRYNSRSRAYYKYLMDELRTETVEMLDNKILMIPMGDAIYELNERLKASPIVNGDTTYNNITSVYGDGNHLSPGVMQYFKALVFFTVFYKEDPRGLPLGSYGNINWYHELYQPYFVEITPEWQTLIQETVWQVTATHFYSGVRDTLKPGDANLDGVVNEEDLTILNAAMGSKDVDPYETGIGWREGDFDGDGDVDEDDLDIYQANTEAEPVDELAQCASFTPPATVNVPCLNINDTLYELTMNMLPASDSDALHLGIDMDSVNFVALTPNDYCASYDVATGMHLNCLNLDALFWVDLQLVPTTEGLELELTDFGNHSVLEP